MNRAIANGISKAGPDFATELVALWTATFEQAYSDVHFRENIQAYCSKNFRLNDAKFALSAKDTECCVHFRDRQATGFYIVKHRECPVPLEGGSAELKQLYVLASEYGSGAAPSLLHHAYDTVQSAGHRWIWLVVADTNRRAQAFYEKHGFSSLGSGPVLEVGRDHLQSAIMSRDLRTD